MDDCRWFFSIDPMKIPPFGLQFHRHAALHVLHGVQTLRLPRLPGKPRDVHDVHDVHGISWDHVQLRRLVETDLWHKRHDQNRTKKIGWWQKKKLRQSGYFQSPFCEVSILVTWPMGSMIPRSVAGPSSHTIHASHMLILGDGREWKVPIRSTSKFWGFRQRSGWFSAWWKIPGCSEKTIFRHNRN